MDFWEGRGDFLRFHLFLIDFCSFRFIYPQSLAAFGQKKSGNDKNTAQSRISAPTLESFRHSRYQRWGRLPPIKSYQQPPAYPRSSPAGITYNLNNVCNAGASPVPSPVGSAPRLSGERTNNQYRDTITQYIAVVNRLFSIYCSLRAYKQKNQISAKILVPQIQFTEIDLRYSSKSSLSRK